MDQPPASPAPAERSRHSLGPEVCPVCAPGGVGPVRAREVDGDVVDQAVRRATEVGGE